MRAATRSAALSRRATLVATRAARKASKACPSGGCEPVKAKKTTTATRVAAKKGGKPCVCGKLP